MLPTIGELIGKPSDKDVPLFGVEIEVEGTSLPNNVKGWAVVPEGSLRPVDGEQGKEYIFNRPYTLIESHKAIDSFVKEWKQGNLYFLLVHLYMYTQMYVISLSYIGSISSLYGEFLKIAFLTIAEKIGKAIFSASLFVMQKD